MDIFYLMTRKVIVLEPEVCDEKCGIVRELFVGQNDVSFISAGTEEGKQLSKMLFGGVVTEPKMVLVKETTYQEIKAGKEG